MKVFWLLLAVFCLGFSISCYEWDDGNEEPTGPLTPPRPLSVTGQRYEKYFLKPSQDSLSILVNLVSPRLLMYTHTVSGVNQYAYNQITIHNVPLSRFTGADNFSARVTGTIAVKGVCNNNEIRYHSLPFDTQANFSAQDTFFERILFWVLTNFNNGDDLFLPLFEPYSSDLTFNETVTFDITVSSALLESFLPQCGTFIYTCDNGTDTEYYIEEVLPGVLVATVDTSVILAPVSRGFFQYHSVLVTWPEEAVLYNFDIASVTYRYDYNPANNTLSILLFEYDTPFTGDIVTFRLKAEGGQSVSRAVSIER